jgi:DNA segregation ATPase FtsK/SpoIIIE, S-DNA-T family
MAKRKSKKKAEPKQQLAPEVAKEIAAIILFALTLLLVIAMFGIGGSLVSMLFTGLKLAFGFGAYVLPLLTAVMAIMLFLPDRYEMGPHNYLGFAGFFISLTGLLHLVVGREAALEAAQQGMGGGFLGFGLTASMLMVLHPVAAAIILTAILVICLVVAANSKLRDLIKGLMGVVKTEKEEEIQINEPATMVINNKLPMRGSLNLGNPKTDTKEEEALTVSNDTEWQPPSLDLLSVNSSKADAGNIKENAQIIQRTMQSFGIDVTMGEVNVGPTVTQYTLTPSSGVKLNKITTLDHNLALSLAAHPIRIEAPIPGKSAVGIEVPNKSGAVVGLKEILASPEMVKAKSPLTFVLGRDVSGDPAVADLAKMPHVLIAGATGTGKSVMINSFLTTLLYRNSPSDLKLILVDPKRVELSPYNDIPHLLAPVITEDEKTISALKWAVAEMQRRYKLFTEEGKRNIIEYNSARKEDGMPYIVIVIDEMAQLMGTAGRDAEALIVQLAQLARATGIHLVLATQRPSVDVITGLIKANIPARIAFTTTSQVDSRTILDGAGAEKLLGKGDMLFSSPEFIKPRRIQGALINGQEVQEVTEYLRKARPPQYNDEVTSQPVKLGGGGRGSFGDMAASRLCPGGQIAGSFGRTRHSRTGRWCTAARSLGVQHGSSSGGRITRLWRRVVSRRY